MQYINEVPDLTFKGVNVLVRSGLNVPIENGRVVNDFRIRRSISTLKYLADRGARVVVISHIGRDPVCSFTSVAEVIKEYVHLTFVSDTLGAHARSVVKDINDGDIVLLENLRQDIRESKNDKTFAKELASLADIFVMDAFSVMHREHASIVGVPSVMKSFAGLLVREEIENLSLALNPPTPSFAILGGAKFETKEPLIQKFIDIYDRLFIGGALANDIFAARGLEVGRSLVSDERPSDEILFHEKVIAPLDVTTEKFDGQARVMFPSGVKKDEKIVDIGPESIKKIAPLIKEAKFVLWNGPMGLYEGGFDEWTRELAKEVAKSDAQTIVGGGDTLASIEDEGLEEEFSFISTGGGAMLQFLLNGTLPGIDALEKGSNF